MAVSKFTSASGGNDFNINVGSTYSVTNFTQEYAAGSYSFTSAQLDTTMDVYAYNAQGTLVGYTNGKGLTTSAGFIKMVILGGTVGDVLSFSYKTTYYATAETTEVTAGPVILSASPLALPNQNSTTVVTGLNFASDLAATFTGTDNLVRTPKSVVRGSATSLVVTRPDSFPTIYSPYSLTVTNPSIAYQPTGSNANILTGFTAGVNPVWVTTNTVSSFTGATPPSYSATDADGGSTVTYSTVSGSLPTGLTLNSNGTFSGTMTTGGTYNHTVRATDSGGNYTDLTVTYIITQTYANATVAFNAGQTTSGYYYIKPPGVSTPYYTYCDMTNQGGGWMLMMTVMPNTSQHVTNNSAVTTAVNSNQTVQMQNSSAYKWSTTDITNFLQQSGNKVIWIEPLRGNIATSDGSNKQLWYAAGTQASPVWPSNLECSNYSSLIASATSAWVYTGYGSTTDARNQTNGSVGNYTGGGHYTPAIYPAGQSFFMGGNGSGIRMATPYTSSTFSDNNGGYLWLKVY